MKICVAVCLVLFWLTSSFRPSDSLLAQSSVDESDSTQQQRPGSAFYKTDEVQTVHLTISEESRKYMIAALPDRIYVPASFRWGDVVIENVGVRFKGNSSSQPRQQHKRSYLVKFDELEKGQRFLGLRRVSFDNGVQFGSLISEPVVTDILRDLQLPTHRANYARLFINDEFAGVYVNVERIDETFVERQFGGKDGLLYKVDEGGPGCNLQFLGDNPGVYKRAFESKSKGGKKGRQRLVEFLRVVNQTPPDRFEESLAENFELDDFLRLMPVMLYAGAFDQLTGWNPHNYYLYLDRETNRWRYLAWDLDVGFSETAFGRIRVLADWNAAWPVAPSGRPNPLVERIMADEKLLLEYRQHARLILDKYFDPERLCKVIDEKYALIREDLKKDPFPARRVTNPSDEGYDQIVESMKVFVRKRYASARQQLESPGPRPEIVHRPHGGGLPPGLPPEFAAKIRRIQLLAPKFVQSGGDMGPVHRLMQRFGPLIQQGKKEEAAKILDQALSIVERKDSNKNDRKPSGDSGTR